MEKKLEEDMEKEKGFEDEKFNRKKEKMIKELREQYEKNLNERQTLSQEQRDMIMKAYQQELS